MKYFVELPTQKISDIVDCLLELLKLITSNEISPKHIFHKIIDELKRVSFQVFGVTNLDGLELFDKFSDKYMLVFKDSPIMNYVKDK